MAEFATFKTAFKGDLVTPSDADYDNAISRWAINSQRKASVVAFVKDAEDVSAAIKYASAAKLPIAIRSGGHSVSGASSSEGGLVIDLSKHLNTVDVDAEKKVAKIAGGAVWETVDKAAIVHGLASVAGTVNHTGVGGLILGGGFGWLTPKHGLTIDNLVQATVVVADGSIVTASDAENPDLFWAIRGGGCNFGVCTEFVMKLHEQRRTVFAGMVIFPPSALEDIVRVTSDWWEKGPSENEALAQALTRAPDGSPCVLLIPFFNGTESEGRQVFKAFFDLNPVADMSREIPYEELNTLINPVVQHGRNVYMRGVTQMAPRMDVAKASFQRMEELSDNPNFRTTTILYEYLPNQKIRSIPHDATAFRSRGPQLNVVVFCMWDENTPEKAKTGRDIVHELANIVVDGEKEPAESDNAGYGNYEGDEQVTPEKTLRLFGNNYPRLQQLKKKYDPGMLFSKWFVIHPIA